MLLALLSPLLLAGVDDIVLDFTVTEPMGTPLVHRQVPLPHTEELPLSIGGEDLIVRVEATLDSSGAAINSAVDLIVIVYRVDSPQGARTRLASPALNLEWGERESAISVLQPANPVYGPDGQPMSELRFKVEGFWSEGPPVAEWITRRRAEPIAQGLTVLAWSDAILYSSPGVGVGQIVAPLDHSTLGQSSVTAWQVLADEGEWLRVRSMTPKESRQHCVGSHQALANMDLRLYIRRQDLLLVTRSSALMEYSDGTSTSLLSGVPLLPLVNETLYGRPAFLGYANGLRFRIGLPEAPVALAYEPLLGGTGQELTAVLKAGSGGVLGQLATGPVELISGAAEAPASLVAQTPKGQSLVSVGGRCAQHRVTVDGKALSSAEVATDDIQFGEDLGAEATTPTLPTGTSLVWPGGGEAGIVRKGRVLLSPARSVGGRTCYDLSTEAIMMGIAPGAGGFQPLVVCVEEE